MSPAASAPAKKKKPAKQPKKKGAKRSGFAKFLLGLGILALIAVVLAAMAGFSAWRLVRPYQGFAGDSTRVVIAPGSSAGQILSLLAEEGVIEDARLARFYLVYFLRDPALKAGEYEFKGSESLRQVLGKISRGDVMRHSITLVEGLTLEEIADQLAKAGFGQRDAFLSLMRSPELIAELDPEAQDLEGYLFPETYNFALGVSEREVVSTLVKTFRARFDKQVAPLLAARPGAPSVRHVVILASIIEKEAQKETDRPLIAAVYENRLDQKIALMADPTVIFALKQLGRWNGNIRRSDLALDSPYNTYKYPGLPPGPIASPGAASLRAAAAPAAVPYLYFVSKNDGSHAFATTLAEHNANVNRWQRQFFRDQRAEERRARESGR
ncbi:MAG TPA: endolytic transglycosylase MltG [Thermoanaerobaculia bacterium]|jgi:UPF0755 protein|nr:endolytic transglycosylase MltG [Thermoanaerobaculia bacterium]